MNSMGSRAGERSLNERHLVSLCRVEGSGKPHGMVRQLFEVSFTVTICCHALNSFNFQKLVNALTAGKETETRPQLFTSMALIIISNYIILQNNLIVWQTWVNLKFSISLLCLRFQEQVIVVSTCLQSTILVRLPSSGA